MSEGSDETKAVVDIHEPESIKQLTVTHRDVDRYKEVPLDSADIIVNGIGFERKTPSDFVSSMTESDGDGIPRIERQIEGLKERFDHAVILLEGGFDGFSSLSHTKMDPKSARGKAASIHMRHGIPVVPTGGTPGTETSERLLVDYAIRLGRKAVEAPTTNYLKTASVGSDEPLGKRLWANFDNIGPERAGVLYDHEMIGSPMQFTEFVTTTSKDPEAEATEILLTVAGIGQKTAERLTEQLFGREDADPSMFEETSLEQAQHGHNDAEGEW